MYNEASNLNAQVSRDVIGKRSLLKVTDVIGKHSLLKVTDVIDKLTNSVRNEFLQVTQYTSTSSLLHVHDDIMPHLEKQLKTDKSVHDVYMYIVRVDDERKTVLAWRTYFGVSTSE